MSLENTGVPGHASLEVLSVGFKERLDKILHKELGVENIENFADQSLSQIIELNEAVMDEYSSNLEIEKEPITDREHEDKAYEVFKLHSVDEILESISGLKTEIESLKNRILENIESTNNIIIPPQPDYRAIIQEGEGEVFGEKQILPRILTLFYILKHDFGIDPTKENAPKKVGIVGENMVRQTPYERVEIPELNRVVYICEEEGNASYIFDTEKLKENGVILDSLDVSNKAELNKLLADMPSIGIRIVYSVNWRDRVSMALGSEIQQVQNNEEESLEENASLSGTEAPLVSKGELDPWRGFWTDKEGLHWGNKMSIIKKLNRTYVIFKKRESDSRLKTMITRDTLGRPKPSYCFEQFMELFPELQQEGVIKVETEGEWRGFWTDPKSGKHWGSMAALQKKAGINDWITIKRYLKKSDLKQVNVTDLSGRSAKGYCYEDLLEFDEFAEFLTAPQVNGEGEWIGCLADDKGRHWAPLGVLADYFEIEPHTIGVYVKRLELPSKNIKTRVGEITPSFCLEDLKTSKDFIEFLNLPKVDKEGPWAGFLTDKNGQHWGPILQISNRLSINRGKIDNLIKKYAGEFQTKVAKDVKGKPHAGYCIEKIIEKLKE